VKARCYCRACIAIRRRLIGRYTGRVIGTPKVVDRDERDPRVVVSSRRLKAGAE
jgi:hypothetical protein